MIVFRCNVGPDVGLGHLTRCRTLAAILREKGSGCIMAGPSQTYRTDDDAALFDAWHPMDGMVPDQDAAAFVQLVQQAGSNVAYMDDYRVDEAYQRALRDAGLRWMQQFDASSPPAFWADYVVHGGPKERAIDYADRTRNPATQFLLGPEYSVLRPQFAKPPERPSARPVETVLVSFGGGDDKGLVIQTLQTLLASTDQAVRFRVMSGRHNPRNAESAAWVDDHGLGRVDLSIDPADVLNEYLRSDVAILAGGTSTFEAAAVGLPMLLVATVGNQVRQCEGWQDRGAAVYLGHAGTLDPARLRNELGRLIAAPEARAAMSAAGRLNVDGMGGYRLAECLLGMRK